MANYHLVRMRPELITCVSKCTVPGAVCICVSAFLFMTIKHFCPQWPTLGPFTLQRWLSAKPCSLTNVPTLYFQSLHNSITTAHNSHCKSDSSINTTRPGRADQSTDQCMCNFTLNMQFKCSDQKRRSQSQVWISFVNDSYLFYY